MNKLNLILIITLLSIISCGEMGSSYDQIIALKTTSQRVYDLDKSMDEIRQSEEKEALSREENDYLEYEYPIRMDESYIVSYRFDEAGCFEVGLDIYFNEQKEVQSVVDGIIEDLGTDEKYGAPQKETDFYRWESSDGAITIELDIQHIERGMIALTIFATE